jgi:hypothetical protein
MLAFREDTGLKGYIDDDDALVLTQLIASMSSCPYLVPILLQMTSVVLHDAAVTSSPYPNL